MYTEQIDYKDFHNPTQDVTMFSLKIIIIFITRSVGAGRGGFMSTYPSSLVMPLATAGG